MKLWWLYTPLSRIVLMAAGEGGGGGNEDTGGSKSPFPDPAVPREIDESEADEIPPTPEVNTDPGAPTDEIDPEDPDGDLNEGESGADGETVDNPDEVTPDQGSNPERIPPVDERPDRDENFNPDAPIPADELTPLD